MIPIDIRKLIDPTDIEKKIDFLFNKAWHGTKTERIGAFEDLIEIKIETKKEQVHKQVSIDLITLNYYHDIKFLLEDSLK